MLVVRFSDSRGQGIYKSSHLCSIHLSISFNDLTRTQYFLQTMHCSPFATLLTLVILVEPLFAYQTIAHRGLFHDVNDHNAVAENSIDAMYRAEALGLPGVEFDLRLSLDNQVLVIHDIVSNCATVNDNYGGRKENFTISLGCREVFGKGQKVVKVYGPIDGVSKRVIKESDRFWKPIGEGLGGQN